MSKIQINLNLLQPAILNLIQKTPFQSVLNVSILHYFIVFNWFIFSSKHFIVLLNMCLFEILQYENKYKYFSRTEKQSNPFYKNRSLLF